MMQERPELWWVLGILLVLLMLSAFFSGSETAMNSVNRYRLAHRARSGEGWAVLAVHMLRTPDKLLGIILVGNNIANITASSMVALMAAWMWGEVTVVAAGIGLTLIILIFAEVIPKSLASSYPEVVVRLVVHPLRFVAWFVSPMAWLVNTISRMFLRIFRVTPAAPSLALNEKELQVLLETAGDLIPPAHRRTILRVLGMAELTVADAMVPHTEIHGLDLEDSMQEIQELLKEATHSCLPVYRRSISGVIGFLSMTTLGSYMLGGGKLDKEVLEKRLLPPVFVPENRSLPEQLKHFRERNYSMALAVDEYGNTCGLVTAQDLISEIAGEFDPFSSESAKEFSVAADGGVVLSGSDLSREINRDLDWKLPDHEEARTINGLILEELEVIPDANICMQLGEYRLETILLGEQTVWQVRIWPLPVNTEAI